jgi:two-component system, NtrC family, response regulator AtoC
VSQTLLLVDDDPAILHSVGRFLDRLGYEVLTETTGAGAIQTWEERSPDLVILDLRLPDAEDLSVLETLRRRDAPVVLLTGHGNIDVAVEAMRLGAENFLTKPVELDHLAAVIERALDRVRLLRENERLRLLDAGGTGLESLGSSPGMRELAARVQLLAETDRTTVLITGESGTGKGWLARVLHGLGRRGRAPFVEVNAAGLTPTFLASELFGHEKGSFTGAHERRDGLFLEAHGGTLFLDEIGELTPELQPRLLNVLETRSFRRVGGTRELTADVRFLTASNRDLEGAVAAGTFREDLYYRLNVARIHLPPLRERTPEDRLGLVHTLLQRLRQEMPGNTPSLSPASLELLLAYPWPGNIREMRNVLERALLFARGAEELRPNHLPREVRGSDPGEGRGRRATFRPESLEEVERRHLAQMLRHHQGNRSRAARDLGIARTTLLQKIERYGLENEGR